MQDSGSQSFRQDPEAQPKSFRTPMLINETMSSKYGTEWIYFLPETLRQSFKKDFNITVDEVLMNKALATQTVLQWPNFNWDIFEKVCLAFNNIVPDFLIIEPLAMMELVWGYVCIKSLQPSYKPGEDVQKYAETVMAHDGLVWAPWLGYELKSDIMNKIKDVWKSPDKETLDENIGVQIDRLSIIRSYIQAMGNDNL